MGSTVNTKHIRLNNEYVALRSYILSHYIDALALVGASVHKSAFNIPKRLGNWRSSHSDLVRSFCPELNGVAQRVERLVEQRDPARIKAQHLPLRRGDNFRRKGVPTRLQINPGE